VSFFCTCIETADSVGRTTQFKKGKPQPQTYSRALLKALSINKKVREQQVIQTWTPQQLGWPAANSDDSNGFLKWNSLFQTLDQF
jgi:hypothetical protein